MNPFGNGYEPAAAAPRPRRVPKDLFLALVAGVLATGAFPDIALLPLAWIALVPLFAAVNGVGPGRGFRLGFAAGLAHYLTLLYWVVYTMGTYGHLPLYFSLPALGLLAAYLSLYTGFFAAGVARLCRSPLRLVLLAPALWVALEYLRTVLFTGFPWLLLGYAQEGYLPLIQIADITGVYGISYWTVTTNACLFVMGVQITQGAWFGRAPGRGRAAAAAAILAGLTAVVCGYGLWKLRVVDGRAAAAEKIRAAVVQGNVDQAVKWRPEFQRTTVQRYIALSLTAEADAPDLVVWPETATPFYFNRNEALSAMIRKAVGQGHAHFIIGSPSFSATKEGPAYFNSAYLVDPDGRTVGRYDKVHLVPFGEYVPLKRFLPFLGKMVEEVGDFSPGRRGSTLDWPRCPLGMQICYEIIFPHLSRSMVENGAGLLVNITNDAWFGRTSAPRQHFSMAVMRAVENRRALVRAANTGISGFIDPAGRIVGRTRLMEAAALSMEVPVMTGQSVYTRFGDGFAGLCLAISALALGHALCKRPGPSQ